jgi:chromosome segregation ATPase
MQTQTQNLERAYARVDEDFKRIRGQVVKLKKAADEEAPLTDEQGNDTPLRSLLDGLPSDKTELEQKKEDLEYKINSIQDNPQVLERYEEESLKLEAEKAKLESLKGSKEAKREELKAISAPWQTKLKNIVSEVNNKFEKYMQELGCAGKFSLSLLQTDLM